MFSALTLDRGQNCRLQDDSGKPTACDIRVAANHGGMRAALIALNAAGRATGALVSSASIHDGITYKRQSEDLIDITLEHASITGDIQSWLLVLSPPAGGAFEDSQTVTAVISANNLPLADFTVDAALLPEAAHCLQLLEIYRHPAQGVKLRAHGAGYPVDATSFVTALGLPADTILQKWLAFAPPRRTHDAAALRDLQKSVTAPLPLAQPQAATPVAASVIAAAPAPIVPPMDIALSAAATARPTPAAAAPRPRRTPAAAPASTARLDDEAVVQGAIAACCLVMVADGRIDMAERRQTMDAIMKIPAARYFPEYDVKCVMDEQLSILRRHPHNGEAAAMKFLHNFAGRREGAQIVESLRLFAGDQASEVNQNSVMRLVALLQKRQAAA